MEVHDSPYVYRVTRDDGDESSDVVVVEGRTSDADTGSG